ncbi:M81 family metallopeptidase [Orrella marina]|uniref:Microcystinase C n=1 Tax=Orrella marina TaxID=2163011 RepID=A0A2R4XLE8_9BURK|nr:M81 family metallopeptidase [Orrella marina]AWB34627.1 MlrC family protein 3 [Orrella marina]
MICSIPRIAILGFHLEANAFSPVSTMADFTAQCWEEGEVISTLARQTSHLPVEIPGFYKRMDETGPWIPVPIIVAATPPGGPAQRAVWDTFMEKVESGLRNAGEFDGVYIANHGASSAIGLDDTETQLVRMIRSIVGPHTTIIATHDLHCNVSEETIKALDALISYRTNPHVDQRERAAEAADLMHEALSGQKLVSAYIRLPITPPSVTLLTAHGPYADAVHKGAAMIQARGEGPIAAVSVCAGFVFSDLPKCGMTVIVTARGDLPKARYTALEIARSIWADRARYVPDTISVASAVEMASTADSPLLLADVADNPGGGGGGNTIWLLKAFHEARVPGVTLGVFIDPAVVANAHLAGVGAQFRAVFNQTPNEFAHRYEAQASVIRLSDGNGTGRRGIYKGREFSLGPSAVLELTDSCVRVVVGSLRRQLADPAMLEMHELDISRIRILVVKSRGHYRAGFDEFFKADQIHDVDSKGLTTPNLAQVPFKRLPRPVWPLDETAHWVEPSWEIN